ncbi:MAG TPA: TRAP transporter small permease subunit, partial [Candidatus Omnitrophota bacterium]|nr:TRAP transporter small permease subunit [Candidatus Omnitrophota bacterium]
HFVVEMSGTDSVSADLEWPMWMIYSAIPAGSYLMCFRFLQVCWHFMRTGELPHHDHGHVEGLEEDSKDPQRAAQDINWYEMDDGLHPKDIAHHEGGDASAGDGNSVKGAKDRNWEGGDASAKQEDRK